MPALTRRAALGLGAAGLLAACAAPSPTTRRITPSDPCIAAAEANRFTTGRVHDIALDARPVTADLAGRPAATWAYRTSLAGPPLRVRVGDRMRATLTNNLPEPTTVHWHGLALRNDADGVPGLTQQPVAPGERYTYDFVVPDAGTYWYHSHAGTQLDRGLYGPLVVEDPADPGVDVDEVLLLDDWLDGISGTPDQELARLRGGMSGMSMGTSMTSAVLGGDAGDVAYPLHLVNGRPPADQQTVLARTGDRVRLRLVNAGSDTAYRVAIGGHRLTVTHADGRPVRPVAVDSLLLGMGERYDVQLVARSGAWPVVAVAEGKTGAAQAVLRTRDAAASRAPAIGTRPAELGRDLLTYGRLAPVASQRLPARSPDRTYRVDLTGSMDNYTWGLGGDAKKLQVRPGQRVRLIMRNSTAMWHPMHLHGHTFAVVEQHGVRKGTIIVVPNQTVTIDLDADNPGQWMYHCHNVYHQSLGMSTILSYVD